MPYPLLVPREQASSCLEYEAQLTPMVGIVAPDPSAMRGKGCLLWKGSEVFVTDDNDPKLIDRLRQMHLELIVLGPVDWDNLTVWRIEAMKRLPINRWFRGASRVSRASLLLSAELDGTDYGTAMRWISHACATGFVHSKQTRWGPLYSITADYYPIRGRTYGQNQAPRPRGRPPKVKQADTGVA